MSVVIVVMLCSNMIGGSVVFVLFFVGYLMICMSRFFGVVMWCLIKVWL